MSVGTLGDIIAKVRRLTGMGTSLQMPDNPSNGVVGITDYINSFYLYDFPAEFRSLKLKDVLTIDLVQGIDVYSFPSEQYITVEMPAYIMKREIKLFQEPWGFYANNFNWQNQQNFAFGDGVNTIYTGTLNFTPIIRSSNNNYNPSVNFNYPSSRVQNILITANFTFGTTSNITDDGNGGLFEIMPNGSRRNAGNINYDTGAVDVSFSTPVPAGNPIQAQYNNTVLNIPLSVLFFQNQFTFRPVPDKGYTFEIVAYRQPSQALANTPANLGTPEQIEWWECIAFGAAKKIYEDRLDSDGIALMDKGLKERYNQAYTRTYGQLGKQRVATIYADQISMNYGNSGWGFGVGQGP